MTVSPRFSLVAGQAPTAAAQMEIGEWSGNLADFKIYAIHPNGSSILLSSRAASDLIGVIQNANIPGRIGSDSLAIADADAALENGKYRLDAAALNVPYANYWLLDVIRYDTTIHQRITQHQLGIAYRRAKLGTWTAWERTFEGLAELDATYVKVNVPLKHPSYTVATLPSASLYVQCTIYVSNGTGNKRLAISDGTNWRFPDGTIVA